MDSESPDAAAIVFYATPLERDLSVSMNAASLMPSEESRRLRAVYAAALQRDPEERDDYLNRACVDQPELRARVAALLQAHSRSLVRTSCDASWAAVAWVWCTSPTTRGCHDVSRSKPSPRR